MSLDDKNKLDKLISALKNSKFGMISFDLFFQIVGDIQKVSPELKAEINKIGGDLGNNYFGSGRSVITESNWN